MRVLLTGASGYAGSGIAEVLHQNGHFVRSLDIRVGRLGVGESIVGDICDLLICERAVDNIDAVVFCHMAKNPDGYKTPVTAVDINVKGTANLYHTMEARGIKRAVLVSSAGLLHPLGKPEAVPGDGPYNLGQEGMSLYVLTKVMQEITAKHYFILSGISTVILRPSSIVLDREPVLNKYGQPMVDWNADLIDPRDVGEAVAAALKLSDPGIEAYFISQDESPRDLKSVQKRLGWHAKYHFVSLNRT